MAVTPELIVRCLTGDDAALGALVEQLTPVIQARVARLLWRYVSAGRDARQDVADFTHQVFVALLEDGGKKLRAWDPERGLTCEQFVSYVAEREVISKLRRKRSSPWTDLPTEHEQLAERVEPSDDPEARSIHRDHIASLYAEMAERMSPLALHMFELIYLRELDASEIADMLSMSRDAVYAWRSRLAKRIRELRDGLDEADEADDTADGEGRS